MKERRRGSLSTVEVYRLVLRSVGKKVTLTPMNIAQNCDVSHLGLKETPKNRGTQ